MKERISALAKAEEDEKFRMDDLMGDEQSEQDGGEKKTNKDGGDAGQDISAEGKELSPEEIEEIKLELNPSGRTELMTREEVKTVWEKRAEDWANKVFFLFLFFFKSSFILSDLLTRCSFPMIHNTYVRLLICYANS